MQDGADTHSQADFADIINSLINSRYRVSLNGTSINGPIRHRRWSSLIVITLVGTIGFPLLAD